MENYLIIRDCSTLKVKRFNASKSVIEPIKCTINDCLENGNDLEFTVPYNATDELNLGDFVFVPSKDGKTYGGVVLGKIIDKKKRIVTYKGVSTRGSMSNIDYMNNSQAVISLYDPEGTRASYYTNGSPKNNMVTHCNYYNAFWGLPISFSESIRIPQETFNKYYDPGNSVVGSYLTIDFVALIDKPLLYALNEYWKWGHQKTVLEQGDSDHLFNVDFRPIEEYTYLITDDNAIISQSIGVRGVGNTSKIVYYNDVGNMITKQWNDPAPNDVANKMSLIFKYNGLASQVNEGNLKARLAKYSFNTPMTTKVKIDSSKINADVGDTLKIIDPDLKVESFQTIVGKRLILDKNETKFEYDLGGELI